MERAAQTFPTLTPTQIDRIAAVGRRRSTPAGEVLFDVGSGLDGQPLGRACARRQVPGALPMAFLKARENAASDS